MKPTRSNESGSAAIEFLAFGLVAQILVTGFGLDLLRQQRAQIVSQSVARQVARLVVAAPDKAQSRVQDLILSVARQEGKPVEEFKVSWLPTLPQAGDWVVSESVVSGQVEFAVMRFSNDQQK